MNLGSWTYLAWLVGCAGPVLGAQWIFFRPILAPQKGAIFLAAAMVGAFLSIVDGMAIADGVWEFSPALCTGLRFGSVPIEEALFFLLTSLLVTQSMTLFTHEASPTSRS